MSLSGALLHSHFLHIVIYRLVIISYVDFLCAISITYSIKEIFIEGPYVSLNKCTEAISARQNSISAHLFLVHIFPYDCSDSFNNSSGKKLLEVGLYSLKIYVAVLTNKTYL